jgi:hypothetical protein
MRSAADVVASVQRYLAVSLGAEWDVRLWSDEGSFSPPIARVSEAGPLLSVRHGRVSVDCTLPLQVHCYSRPERTPTASLARAREVEELLHGVIEVGRGDARPRRIPLYDAASETRAYYDFVRVTDFSVNRVTDSADPTITVVVADLRLAWSRSTLADVTAVTAAELRLREEPA